MELRFVKYNGSSQSTDARPLERKSGTPEGALKRRRIRLRRCRRVAPAFTESTAAIEPTSRWPNAEAFEAHARWSRGEARLYGHLAVLDTKHLSAPASAAMFTRVVDRWAGPPLQRLPREGGQQPPPRRKWNRSRVFTGVCGRAR